jgi:hypothetical protein
MAIAAFFTICPCFFLRERTDKGEGATWFVRLVLLVSREWGEPGEPTGENLTPVPFGNFLSMINFDLVNDIVYCFNHIATNLPVQRLIGCYVNIFGKTSFQGGFFISSTLIGFP